MRTPSFLRSLIVSCICFVLIPTYFFNLGWVRVHLVSHDHNNSDVSHQIANTVDEHSHSHHHPHGHSHHHDHSEPDAPSNDDENKEDQKQHHPHSVADHIALCALLVTSNETIVPDSCRLKRAVLTAEPVTAPFQYHPDHHKARGPPVLS